MKINTIALLAALTAGLATSGVFAQATAPAGKTREEVKAELKTAKKNDCYEATTSPVPKSEKSRAEVKAAAKGASTECEASASPEPKSTTKRADVKAELQRATKAGEIPHGEGGVAQKK